MVKFFLITYLLINCTNTVIAQPVKTIRLNPHKEGIRLEHYRIVAVKDNRADTNFIGSLQTGAGNKNIYKIYFSAASDIFGYARYSIDQNASGTATELHISNLAVSGKLLNGKDQQLTLSMSLAFLINKKKLVEYSVKSTDYTRTGQDATGLIEQMIKKGLVKQLQEFDTWWAKNQESSVISDSVKMDVILETGSAEKEMIVYTGKRALTLPDFTGKPEEDSRGDAATYSGMAIKYDTEIDHGQLKVIARITPFFDRTRSWCREKSRNAKTLEHEQHHFDITAIKACELVNELRKHIFTITNYSKEPG